ncbi:CLUMA_CG000156, isoform A [Clunio marinus]|uniref:CLUMA_CG000156, isoform A n=1 Tax=Clunio marinus TaxID=568069 RepID=A0A1J1HEY1_9DIPT|nr:CLUMA_CG000156, isoform A [Clunio marinus]
MPISIMQKNYSNCPLKKRPVFIVKEESDSELEPENLSTKPEDLMLRTGKVSVLKTEKQAPEVVQEIRIISSQSDEKSYDYSAPKSPTLSPLDLHTIKPDISPVSSPIEPLNFTNPNSWHKPVNSPNPYSNYLTFPAFPYPPSEAYTRLYHHQISPVRDSSLSPPSYSSSRSVRDSSVSPPAPVFIQPYVTSDYRRNNILKPSESYSHHHRYMPYQLNHHHHNLLPVDQSSLSPTSSHASYNSFASSSNASMRSISPPCTALEDLPANYSISVLMEKSTSSTNIQKSLKLEKNEKTSAPPRYQCPDCGKSYSTYSGLSKHQQFHCAANESNQVQKTVTCNECGKVYASTGALKMHIRTHTLPCKCHLCGKAFSRPWLLQGHIRTHTGEKPFSCNHCHRAFADRSNLRAHLQTHSDVKKYSCTTCSKTFSRMSLLTKHNDSGCPGLQITQNDGYSNQISPAKNIQVY